jgi:autotransporter-associated beta strand protein
MPERFCTERAKPTRDSLASASGVAAIDSRAEIGYILGQIPSVYRVFISNPMPNRHVPGARSVIGRIFRGAILPLLCGLVVVSASAQLVISNSTLEVNFNTGSGLFSVTDFASTRTYIQQGNFNNTNGTASVVAATNATFGAGQEILVTHTDGSSDTIMVFPGVPFALFQSTLSNGLAQTVMTNHVHTLTALVNMNESTSSLAAIGTGGLTTPGSNPGSYMWLAVADAPSRNGVVSAWLTTDRGSGIVFGSVSNSLVRVDAQIDYGRLQFLPGQTNALETFAIGYFPDTRVGLETWASEIAQVYQIHLNPQPDGYDTYPSSPNGGASSPSAVEQLADFAKTNLEPFGFSMIQIDSGWQAGITTTNPNDGSSIGAREFLSSAGNYSAGMTPVSSYLANDGLTSGLWFSPCGSSATDPYFTNHQDWFVETTSLTPYWVDFGGACLDATDQNARGYISNYVSQIANTWNYKYFKMDGLWSGSAIEIKYVNSGYSSDDIGDAIFANPAEPNIQAFRDGLKLVRQAAGANVYMDGCNIAQNMRSYGGSFGLLDGIRIGPDNAASWGSGSGSGSGWMRSAEFGSRHYFLQGRVWYNDPDSVYVRTNFPEWEAQAISSWYAMTGQLALDGDWIPGLPADRLNMLKRMWPHHGLLPRPVDYLENDPPQEWLLTTSNATPQRNVIGLFNWSSNTVQNYNITLAHLGLNTNTAYEGFDFWANGLVPVISGSLQSSVPANSCQIISVRPASGTPQLISTSRHITQGVIDVLSETWNGTNTLNGQSQLVGGDPYELRIVTSSNNAWSVVSAAVSAADQTAGVTVGSVTQSNNLARVQINSPTSRQVTWSVVFTPVAFVVTATPPSQTVGTGTNISYAVTVTGTNGFANAVTLSVSGLPTGVGAVFNPPSVTGSGGSTLSLTVSNSALNGDYPLTITGVGGGTTNSAGVVLIVNSTAALEWTSAASDVWDTATTNWFNLSLAVNAAFQQFQNVQFDDSAGVATTVDIGSALEVEPTTTTVASSLNNFTLAGPGEIGGAGNLVKTGSSTLTINATNVLTGGVSILGGTIKAGGAQALGSAGVVISNGTLDVNGLNLTANPVVLSGAGAGGGGTVINSGAQQISALRTVTLAGDTTLGGTGRWDIRNTGGSATISTSPAGSAFNLTKVGPNQISLVAVSTIDSAISNITVQQGEFAVQTSTTQVGTPAGTITVWSNAILDTYQLTATPLNKNIVFNGGAEMFGEKGPSIIAGPVTLNGGATTFDVTNNGTPPSLTMNGAIGGTGGLTLTGGGNLVLAGSDTYSGSTVVSAGALILTNGGSISSSTVVNVGVGATLSVSPGAGGTLTLAPGQTLTGYGTVGSALVVGPGATVSPAAPGVTGTLMVTGAATIQGTAAMKLNKAAATNDVLQANSLTYQGTLAVTNLGGALASGDKFQLFSAGSYGGAFTNILPAIPRVGLGWITSGLTNTGVLQVTTAAPPPPPRITGISVAGGGLSLRGTNGVAGGTYYVLSATNITQPLGNWVYVATNAFDANGNFVWSNAVAPGSPQRFYLLRLQ